MWSVLVPCFVSKEEDGHVSFSSFDPELVLRHSKERPVWSCGVVEWIGRPLISPTPSPGHRQVTHHVYVDTCLHTIHVYTHTHTHTHTHIHTYTHTPTHAHTHFCMRANAVCKLSANRRHAVGFSCTARAPTAATRLVCRP